MSSNTLELNDWLVLLVILSLSMLVLVFAANPQAKTSSLGDSVLKMTLIPGLICIFLAIDNITHTLDHLVEMNLTLLDFLLIGTFLLMFLLAANEIKSKKKK